MRVMPFLGASFIRLLHGTLRVRHVGAEKIEALPQYIIAFWHEHLAVMLHSRYRRPIEVLVSQSRDGELIASTFGFYGVGVARGSSTRGASAALRGMIRSARQGTNLVFTPDGPKGPRRVVKEGLIYAAQATALPIVPIAFAAKKKSSSAPGTACSSPCLSLGRCSSTATPSRCRGTKTWNRRGCAWRGR